MRFGAIWVRERKTGRTVNRSGQSDLTPQLFTPVFTPARFFIHRCRLKIAEVIATQTQTQIVVEFCPTSGVKRTCYKYPTKTT